jgi:hypothetical protein
VTGQPELVGIDADLPVTEPDTGADVERGA